MRRLTVYPAILLGLLLAYTPAVGLEQIAAQKYQERLQHWEMFLSGLEFVENEVIVEFDDARSLCSVDAAKLEGFEFGEVFRYRPLCVFRITGEETVAQALARLEGVPGIRRAEPNLIRHLAIAPNDTLYPRQEYMQSINAPSAWNVTVGMPTVRVAVIDSGVDLCHPEFAGRIIYTENTRDPDLQGSDNVFDDSGHGTAVTGIIAAEGNNGIGIAGMAWDIRILSFRACGGPMGGCPLSAIVQAMDSAVFHGAQVINLSLGGEGGSEFEQDAVHAAYAHGVVIVASAGNGGKLYHFTGEPGLEEGMVYPAGFPEVIGVAAMDNQNGALIDPADLVIADFSNYGEDIVSVAAVGVGVLTTVPFRPKEEVPYAIYPSPNYARLTGTSFSCPQVAGAACLIISRFPGIMPYEVRDLLEDHAFGMGGPDYDFNGVDDFLGYGVIDIAASLGAAIEEVKEEGGLYENEDFRAGVCNSPVFVDDIIVVVECKQGCDYPPEVSYFVRVSGEAGNVVMEHLPSYANMYVGVFRTVGTGEIEIQVAGALSGRPLEPLSFVYTQVK